MVELPGECASQDHHKCRKAASKTAPQPVPLNQATSTGGHQPRVVERPPGGAAGQNKSVIQSTSTSTALGQKSEALSHLNASASSRAKPKAKLFSLLTYKLHALGDYMWTIQLFGTTDSYSTQIVRSQLYSEGAD